jgi:hypothetical protein
MGDDCEAGPPTGRETDCEASRDKPMSPSPRLPCWVGSGISAQTLLESRVDGVRVICMSDVKLVGDDGFVTPGGRGRCCPQSKAKQSNSSHCFLPGGKPPSRSQADAKEAYLNHQTAWQRWRAHHQGHPPVLIGVCRSSLIWSVVDSSAVVTD